MAEVSRIVEAGAPRVCFRKRAKKQQHRAKLKSAEVWRRQLDVEILNAYEEKDPKDKLHDQALKVRQTTAYQKYYEGSNEPIDATLKVRRVELQKDKWTLEALQGEVARLDAEVASSDDGSEDDDDEYDGDNDGGGDVDVNIDLDGDVDDNGNDDGDDVDPGGDNKIA